jgi:hypothetical protein
MQNLAANTDALSTVFVAILQMQFEGAVELQFTPPPWNPWHPFSFQRHIEHGPEPDVVG